MVLRATWKAGIAVGVNIRNETRNARFNVPFSATPGTPPAHTEPVEAINSHVNGDIMRCEGWRVEITAYRPMPFVDAFGHWYFIWCYQLYSEGLTVYVCNHFPGLSAAFCDFRSCAALNIQNFGIHKHVSTLFLCPVMTVNIPTVDGDHFYVDVFGQHFV